MNPVAAVVIQVKPTSDSLADKLETAKKCPIHGEDEECNCGKKVAAPINLSAQKDKYISMEQRTNILKFLKHLNEKNYAEANKYLKNLMEQKLMARIQKQKNVRIF